MNIAQLYSRLSETWHVEATAHYSIVQAIVNQLTAMNWTPPVSGPSQDRGYSVENGVAVLSINGPMVLRPMDYEKKYLGVVGMEDVSKSLDTIAKDGSVNSVVLHITSPGGTANGSTELASKVRALNAMKPCVAYADSQMCSAAYQLGAQASAIIAAPSAEVGSIGAMISRVDTSKLMKSMGVEFQVFRNADSPLKGMGNPAIPLTAEQEDHLQSKVDQHAAVFKRYVMSSRPGIKPEAMKGQSLFGEKALSLGLVDQHGDLSHAINTASRLGVWKSVNR